VIRNFILDWSGTLVDDLPAVLEATNYVLMRAGRTPLSLEQFKEEFALPFTVFYERITPEIPIHQLEEWFHEAFRKYQNQVRALPFANEFLAFCRENKIKTYLLSAVHPDYFEEQYRRAGFTHTFNGLYLSVHDKRKVIKQVLEENQLEPTHTALVGDMCHDLECARAGGIRAVAVLTGYNTRSQLLKSKPDLVVDNLKVLMELLREHNIGLPSEAFIPLGERT